MNYLDEGGVTKIARKIKAEYVAKENGKGLSSNDFTDALKDKLENLTSVFRFKGIVATVQDLPSTADDGDIYGVGTSSTGFTGYIYFGGTWHEWESINPNEIDYNILQNKPQIGGIILEGNQTASQLNLVDTPTFTTALNNKLNAPSSSGTANTVLINDGSGNLTWGSIGGIASGNQTINGTVTINVTASTGIACWLLNRNNTTAGFIEMLYSNTRACVIGKGSTGSNNIYVQTYNGYALIFEADNGITINSGSNFVIVPSCQQDPSVNNHLTRKSYVDAIKSSLKTLVAASTDFADFKNRVASW